MTEQDEHARVVDLAERIAERSARHGEAARRGITSIAELMEQEAARLPIESELRALFVASALVLRHGVASGDDAELEWMVKASHWLIRGMTAPDEPLDDH